MANVPPNDAELDELLDSALEEFTAPSPKPKTEPKAEPAPSTQKPAGDETPGFEDEFVRQLTQGMEDMFKNSAAGGNEADEREMRNMLDQLLKQMGPLPSDSTAPPAKDAAEAVPKVEPTDKEEPQSFQDKIKATMDKLKESADQADAESGDMGEMGMMEELMRQLDQTGDDPQLDSLVDDVIGQLMSKDVLEQPLKDLDAAYPKYLVTNKASLSAEEFQRYTQQHEYIKEILKLFAASEGDAVNDPRIVELMQKMQDCGQPPNELLKLLAPDMELDEKGEVKVPEAPNCTIM
ncbi:Peroxisome chaperone and import receptor [Coemansia sp. RSA 2618]|nr:Peroxisome chaperone and import receptor [Coemansia sp. RSA 2618]